LQVVMFFFFSSRRRHTRFSRDWSSDVCSSDLAGIQGVDTAGHEVPHLVPVPGHGHVGFTAAFIALDQLLELVGNAVGLAACRVQIGRASCRERVYSGAFEVLDRERVWREMMMM